jgi:hypothetical protein
MPADRPTQEIRYVRIRGCHGGGPAGTLPTGARPPGVASGGIRPAPRSSPMTDRFTDELWAGAAGIYAAILAHPFLAGLTDGSLPEDAFA